MTLELPMTTLVRLEQEENAKSPMLLTLLPIVMFVRLVQSRNASSPMLVKLPGMLMLVRLQQLDQCDDR